MSDNAKGKQARREALAVAGVDTWTRLCVMWGLIEAKMCERRFCEWPRREQGPQLLIGFEEKF